jgi:hypothetical protein
MKKTVSTVIIFILLLGAFLTQAVGAASSPAYVFSDQELDELLAPIALYPDPLLAVMLPASTYPEEIDNADAWLKRGGAVSGINGQSWDESVKAIAYYPDILNMMAGDLDWIADLGDAFINQPEDVTRSIQRLRWQARDIGNLESNNNQQVIIDGENIEIIPAQPDYMYVPQYDASVVYEESWGQGSPPFITYGIGLAIGGWLYMDFDWRNRHVIYHGWNRPGWVNHARPYIHVPNVYIDRSRPFIKKTWKHDISHGDPEKFRASQPGRITGKFANAPDVRGRETIPAKRTGVIFGPKGDAGSFSNRGRQSLGTINQRQTQPADRINQQPSIPVPGIVRGSSPARPAGESVQTPKTPVTLRGWRGSDVNTQSQRQAPSDNHINQQPPAPASGQTSGISRGSLPARPAAESVQLPKTPSVTFGGYRGGSEAKQQSIRGQSSRQSGMEIRPSVQSNPAGKNIQSPGTSSAPVSRGNAPANRGNASGGKSSSGERHGR